MKRMIYQVAVGAQSKLYQTCIASVDRYCSKHSISHVVQTNPILKIKPDESRTNRHPRAWEEHGGFLPIFEKENAFDYWNQYDQIAIIDSDIYICNDAPNIFEELDPDTDFAGVAERDMPLSKKYLGNTKKYSRQQYDKLAESVDFKTNQNGHEYFNMGMMLMNKSISKYLHGQNSRQFITRREFKDFVDGVGDWKWSTDQTLLNYWIKKEKMNVKNLSWHWNALYSAVPNSKLYEANFIHFFQRKQLPNNGENIVEVLESIGKK